MQKVEQTMSIVDGQETYKVLAEKTNRYAAIRMIAAEARKRANQCNNMISHSEAISWVLTGEKPKKLVLAEKRGQSIIPQSYFNTVVHDELVEIEDDEVRQAVACSLKLTRENQNLVYVYNKIQDEPRRARVRILTRMIWDKITNPSG